MPQDDFTISQWYAVARLEDVSATAPYDTKLLDRDIVIERVDGALRIRTPAKSGASTMLPVQERYGHVWTTLSSSPRDLYAMPEFEEPGRRLVTAGAITVRCSGLRVVENFLDMAHFPFVHTGILGEEPHTTVADYDVEVREDTDEVWATKCEFFQPKAAAAAEGGQLTKYMYRVPQPFSTVLYKTCPVRSNTWDLVGLFIQPKTETECDVHSFVLVYDDETTDNALIQFQQMIFMQDRMILENQVPSLLPLDPRLELPTRADASSIAFRRWLKSHGQSYGVFPQS
ncbi:MAG: (2Fe-2S)-binding protein [Leifsonia xyli]|jgi:phenylpropionate dioxygenase-like ring-hydroxylating dioxygenase large terminal subunit|nr:MAG: (2Fe-2S)-binding protein [Leifsonia xyli]